MLSNPDIEINLMYQHERDEYFKQLEGSKEKKKPKQGPRDILGTRVDPAVTSFNFNKEKFKERLSENISKILNVPNTFSREEVNITEPMIHTGGMETQSTNGFKTFI